MKKIFLGILLGYLLCWILVYIFGREEMFPKKLENMRQCSGIDTGNCLDFYTHPMDSKVSVCKLYAQETCIN